MTQRWRRDRRRRRGDDRDPTPGASATLAVIYTRVSTDEQSREGTSLPTQLAECRRAAAEHGWLIDHEYTDTMSGLRSERPEYQALLARVVSLAAAGQHVTIVVSMLDRFGRDSAERQRVSKWLAKIGVPLFSVREGGVQTKLAGGLSALLSEEESDRLGLRIRATWANLADRGWFKVSANIAWGYRSRPATAEERAAGSPRAVIEPDPTTAPYVVEAFERCVRGESIRTISAWARTLPGDTRGMRRGAPRKLTPATIAMLLRNPVYVARFAPDDPPTGRWKPLIDDATWHAAQRELDRRAATPRAQPGRFPLTGFMACPDCGERMGGASVQRGTRQYRYYRCIPARHGYGTCNGQVDGNQVEARVFEAIGTLIDATADAHVQRGLRRTWKQLAQPDQVEAKRVAKRRADLERQIAESERAINGATRKLALDQISKAAYDGMVADEQRTLDARRDELKALSRVATQPALPPLDDVLAAMGTWSRVVGDVGDVQVQRELLGMLVDKIHPIRVKPHVYDATIDWTPLAAALATRPDGAVA